MKTFTLGLRLKASHVFAERNAAAAGLGSALLALVVARPMLQDRRLAPVLADWTPPPVPVDAA